MHNRDIVDKLLNVGSEFDVIWLKSKDSLSHPIPSCAKDVYVGD